MAFVSEENFDSYADEANLAGASGGSGWGGNWTNGAVNLIRSDTAITYQGAAAARVITSGGGNTFYTRLLTSAISDNGITYVAMHKSVNNAGENAFTLRSSVGQRCNITMNASGNVTSQGTTILTGYTANTWYVFRITFSVTAGNYTVAYSTDPFGSAGTFSAESSTITMANSGNIDRVGLGGDTHAGTCHTDYISATTPFSAGGSSLTPTLMMMGVGS